MRLEDILKQTIEKLKRITKNPHLEAENLLSFILDKSREFILLYPETKLTIVQVNKLSSLIKKRLDGESIAYLIGTKHFYDCNFFVNKNVLVPRPETELMVDEVLSIFKKIKNNSKVTLIDIGTGSACIPISILNNTKEYKNIKCLAVDVSTKALEIAMKNAKKYTLEKNIIFLKGNLLKPIIKSAILNLQSKIIITANLPYLTKKQIEASPSIQKEPLLALDGGENGMYYYIELFKQINHLLRARQHISMTVLTEIDHTQIEVFKEELKSLLPIAKLKIKKDLGGYDRLAIIKI